MKKFDWRTAANLEVALETVCRKLPSGGDHETRKRVAEALLRAAMSGHKNLGDFWSPSAARRCGRQTADRPDHGEVRPGPGAERYRSRRQTASPAHGA